MYRNSEGYADPTAGAAFAHMAYEERQKRRQAAEKRRKAAEAEAAATALRKKEKEARRREIRNRKREAYYNTLTWVQAWPKVQPPTEVIGEENH